MLAVSKRGNAITLVAAFNRGNAQKNQGRPDPASGTRKATGLCDRRALITARVDTPAWTLERAAQALRDGAGTRFDPAVVAAFTATEDEFRSIASQLFGEHYEPAAQPQEALIT
jgi:hypothetical protein